VNRASQASSTIPLPELTLHNNLDRSNIWDQHPENWVFQMARELALAFLVGAAMHCQGEVPGQDFRHLWRPATPGRLSGLVALSPTGTKLILSRF
jgi:hypothetical protein